MTNEEMKVVKFERLIKELEDKLCVKMCFCNSENEAVRSESILVGNESVNPYVKALFEYEGRTSGLGYYGSCEAKISNTIDQLLDCAKRCNLCSNGTRCNVSFRTIFFSLLILAIDNDLYNEKLEIVSDAAYLMGFDEEMIEDWIYAVKKFLLVETIELEQMKTEKGRSFFAYFVKQIW